MASSCSSSVLLPSPTLHSHCSTSANSLLHPPTYNIPTTTRSFSLNYSPFDHQTTSSLRHKFTKSKRNLTLKASTIEENVSSVIDSLPSLPVYNELKLKLLSAVSGLNKGLVAKEEDMKKVDSAAKELEEVGGVVDLSADLDKLQGRWKLIYSSAFSSRTLGGSRPGPPIGRLLPITLGQVFQRIDTFSKDFDNIVELQLGTPWPLSPVEVTATLAHKFELTGSAKIKIVFEKTTVKTTGDLSQIPPFELPKIPDAFRPSSNTGSGEFEVTYLDADTRITRGDRGELRVFVIS